MAADSAPAATHPWWQPVGDPSRRRRIGKVAGWIAAVALVVALLELAGIDVGGWFRNLWHTLTELGFGYLVAGWALVSVQTALTALGWFFILRAGFPDAPLDYRQVLAAYATGVALNAFLPANLGTLVMLLMYVAIVSGGTFAGMVGALSVQKLFYVLLSAFAYVYLLASVPGTSHRQLRLAHDHPVLVALIAAVAVLLIALLVRIFRQRLRRQWEHTKKGGAILAHPRAYLVRVVLPSFGAWLAALATIGVFLAGYGIPVTFDTVMRVSGGNSLAGSVAVTPGGVGIDQATNVAALADVTDAARANAYSLGQQLAVTGWKVVFALVLVGWAFGWSQGRALIQESYAEAKVKAAEEKAQRKRRRAATRAARR